MNNSLESYINEINRLINYDRSKTLYEQKENRTNRMLGFNLSDIQKSWNDLKTNFNFENCGSYRYIPNVNDMIREWNNKPEYYISSDINNEVRQWISKKLLQAINDRIYQYSDWGKNPSFKEGIPYGYTKPNSQFNLSNVCFGDNSKCSNIVYSKKFSDNPDNIKNSIPTNFIVKSKYPKSHANYHSDYIDWYRMLINYAGTMDMCRLEERFWKEVDNKIGKTNYKLTTKDVHNILEGIEIVTGLLGVVPFPPAAVLFNTISIAAGTINAGLYAAEGKNYDAAIALGLALIPGPELSRLTKELGEEAVESIAKIGTKEIENSVKVKKGVDILNLPNNAKIFNNGVIKGVRDYFKKAFNLFYEENGIVKTMKYFKLLYDRAPKSTKIYLEIVGPPVTMDTIYYLWSLSLKEDDELTAQEKRYKSDFKPIVDAFKRPDKFIKDLILQVSGMAEENLENIGDVSMEEIENIVLKDISSDEMFDNMNTLRILRGKEPYNKEIFDEIINNFLSSIDGDSDGEYDDWDGTNEEKMLKTIKSIESLTYYSYINKIVKEKTGQTIIYWIDEEMGDTFSSAGDTVTKDKMICHLLNIGLTLSKDKQSNWEKRCRDRKYWDTVSRSRQ